MRENKGFDAKEFRRRNDESRMWFVKYWAEYVRTHSDKDWSRQQKVLIDSQIKNAQELKIITPKEYLKIKEKKNKFQS